MNKIYVLGGGTFSHVRCHLALATPAFGETARELTRRINDQLSAANLEERYRVYLTLTKMAEPISSKLITNQDVADYVHSILQDPDTKGIVFNVALTDFTGQIDDVISGKYADRLQSREGPFSIDLTVADKVIADIKAARPDIILVGFKTTSGDTQQEQLRKGLRLIEQTDADIVLANDLVTRSNQIITPSTTQSRVIFERKSALRLLTAELITAIKRQHVATNI